jgi:hypothetical protein
VCILVLGFRGSLVFRLPPYNPSGERMTTISLNPSSFPFAFFHFHFSFGISRTSVRAYLCDLERGMDDWELS